MLNIYEIIFIIISSLISFFCGFFLYKLKQTSSLANLKAQLHINTKEREKLENALQQLQEKYLCSEKKVSELSIEKSNLQNWHNQSAEHFKNLSQDILDKNSKQFQEQAEANISTLLNPFKERIQSFQKTVEETYQNESRERFSLKDNIKELCNIHKELKKETQHLSMVMKGNVKAQGQWGEMILNKILDAAGLVEGEHYITQGKELGLKDEEGKQQKPDVIIKLPDEKHIIIDSKVSLTHYEKFISSELEEDKKRYLSQFTQSIRSHVLQLSEKKYTSSETLNTPDFTLMFFPIEGAFSLALQYDPHLFQFSWDKNIVIVSPTTLLSTLKTVESIWKREKQSRNAIEIAQTSGRLYDKFVGFVDDLNDIGYQIKKADKSYSSALHKLNTGHGNIISRLEKIKSLGARTSKKIPENLLPIK